MQVVYLGGDLRRHIRAQVWQEGEKASSLSYRCSQSCSQEAPSNGQQLGIYLLIDSGPCGYMLGSQGLNSLPLSTPGLSCTG